MALSRRTFLKFSSLSLLPISKLGFAASKTQQIDLTLRPETQTWFSSQYPAIELWGSDIETLYLKQHQAVEIKVANHLPSPTTLHWHGMRVANRMDGVSGMIQQPIAPQSDFTYQLTPKDAGTYWAHAHHNTYEQLARGLYFPLIVKEETPYPAEQDLLLVIDDWLVNQQRQLDTESLGQLREWAHGGRQGNVITVNRKLNHQYPCKSGERVRLRVLNAANSRIMTLSFPEVKLWMIAKDGQPLSTPLLFENALTVGPAERYDFIVDIPLKAANLPIYEISSEQKIPVASWEVMQVGISPVLKSPPAPLPANPLAEISFKKVQTDKTAHKVKLLMEGGAMGNLQQATYKNQLLEIEGLIEEKQIWAFNGIANLADKPLVTIKSGDMVEIDIINKTTWPHAMHLHGHHFKTDSVFYPKDIWHDTLLIPGRDEAKIVFRAGEKGKWLLHCHMIEHQVSGMVTWIDVV